MEQKTILYVDDEPINTKLLAMSLRKNFKVLTAFSGAEGLALLNNPENKIEIVISDMKMPEMNGIEFIRAAKQQHPDLSYYILSGYDLSGEIQHALDDNTILKYFKKPFDKEEIITSLEYNLNKVQ